MDLVLATTVNRLGRGWMDPLTELFCAISFLVVLWLAVLVVVWWRDRPRRAMVIASAGLALGIHFLVNELVLKHALLTWVPMRIRPWMAHPELIVPVGFRFEDSSFPSSHAASTAALALVFGWFYPRFRPFGAALVVAMAFARVHNGMHYPTDVLAGTVLGLAYGAIAVLVIERRHARSAPPPGTAPQG